MAEPGAYSLLSFALRHAREYHDAMPVFDEEAMRAVIGCSRGRMGRTSDEWLDETRGRVGEREGTVVTVFAKASESTVRLPPALQAELEASLEEADREEGISWDELSRKLQKCG